MTRNKKGFTLVELVIVIAVIAILAGVMIAVFSGVVKRANESAELQKIKNEELAQKADDILKKVDNSNWFSWEDFENSLAAKMTEVYKANANQEASTSVDDIQKAVKAAVKEYFDSNAKENTQLTEAQVKVIVENALASARLGGVTEAQVRTIVNTAVAGISTVSKAQVQAIVDAAVAKGLTAAQVAEVIGNSGLAKASDVTAVSTKVDTVITAINTLSANMITPDDVAEMIIKLLPVTYAVSSQEDVNVALSKVNSFSTLRFTSDFAANITLSETDNRTLMVSGVKLENLTINAPIATIYIVTDEGAVKVESVADHSLHISGKVDSLEINSGRAVVEEGGEVTNLKAAPSLEALVKVVIEEGATVTNLEANYQKNGNGTNDWIEVENNGTVGTAILTVVAGTAEKTDVTTNVKVTGTGRGTEAKEVADATTTEGLVIEDEEVVYTTQSGAALAQTTGVVDTTKVLEGSGIEADPYVIRTVEELQLVAALVNDASTYDDYTGEVYYKLTSNLDISDTTWTPIGDKEANTFVGVFDGNGKTITGLNNRASFDYVGAIVITATNNRRVEVYGLFGFVGGTSTIKSLTLASVDINSVKGSGVGAVAGYVASTKSDDVVVMKNATVTFKDINVSGTIVADDNVGGIAGRSTYSRGTGTVTFDTCSVDATLTATRTENGFARAGGIVGMKNNGTGQMAIIKNCTVEGTVTGRNDDAVNFPKIGALCGQNGASGGANITVNIDTSTGNETSKCVLVDLADN